MMSSEKKPYSEVVKKPRKKKEVVPEPEAVVYSSEKATIKEKVEYKSNVPAGWVRVMALQDYVGMTDVIYAGDVYDLPERRFKSLSFRGLVEEYKGDGNPLNKR